MSKYTPLWDYIRTKRPDFLTFRQIEEICGFPIDHSFLNYKKELISYGFAVEKISRKNETVRFCKSEETT